MQIQAKPTYVMSTTTQVCWSTVKLEKNMCNIWNGSLYSWNITETQLALTLKSKSMKCGSLWWSSNVQCSRYICNRLTVVSVFVFAAGGADKTDTQYDVKNGIRSLRVSPDGMHLATGDKLGNVRLVSTLILLDQKDQWREGCNWMWYC